MMGIMTMMSNMMMGFVMADVNEFEEDFDDEVCSRII